MGQRLTTRGVLEIYVCRLDNSSPFDKFGVYKTLLIDRGCRLRAQLIPVPMGKHADRDFFHQFPYAIGIDHR
jgi:hypothetical protein